MTFIKDRLIFVENDDPDNKLVFSMGYNLEDAKTPEIEALLELSLQKTLKYSLCKILSVLIDNKKSIENIAVEFGNNVNMRFFNITIISDCTRDEYEKLIASAHE